MNNSINWAINPSISELANTASQACITSNKITLIYATEDALSTAIEDLLELWEGTNWYWNSPDDALGELTIWKTAPELTHIVVTEMVAGDNCDKTVFIDGLGHIDLARDAGVYDTRETWQCVGVKLLPRQHLMSQDSIITVITELIPKLAADLNCHKDSLLVEFAYADAYKLLPYL